MYETAKAMDITLITISLRYVFDIIGLNGWLSNPAIPYLSPFLMKYHNQLLTLHGPSGSSPGRWTLSRIGTPEERMSLNREIGVLEEKLKEVAGWEARVKELEALLGVEEGINDHDDEVDRDDEQEAALRSQESLDGLHAATSSGSDGESEAVNESEVSRSEIIWKTLDS